MRTISMAISDTANKTHSVRLENLSQFFQQATWALVSIGQQWRDEKYTGCGISQIENLNHIQR